MQSLKEMLHDLQCFKITHIDLCCTVGNGFGAPYWRIRFQQTIGGDKFKFSQPLGRQEGSGIYYDTVAEAEAFAQSVVRGLFKKQAEGSRLITDANEYDWHPRGNLAEV